MGNFEFITTKDGSIGLFNLEINDIYHAREGALDEAINKFAVPSLKFIEKFPDNSKLKVCDICFGLGYNTYAFLNFILNKKYSAKFSYIEISALEYDKELVILSPFIRNKFLGFYIRKILLKAIKKQYSNEEILDTVNKYRAYTDEKFYELFKAGIKHQIVYKQQSNKKKLFLHNTYYNYISTRFKNALNLNKINGLLFNVFIGDARKTIYNIPDNQNLVFLDAFDPKKLPTLWSKEFFDAIYSKSDINMKLLTYSHAACVRSAMKEANFLIGNNFNNGTSASKNNLFPEEALTEYEKGLLYTSAGICFRDYNLDYTKEELIQDRLRRVKSENRESSTHYAKTHQK